MKFLEQPPRFLFFTGKGGVGKTSIACATAIQLAEAGKRVLLVSTDPASNVGQIFGVSIGNKITAIPDVAHLSAMEIDPQAAAQAYRDRIVGPVRGVLPESCSQRYRGTTFRCLYHRNRCLRRIHSAADRQCIDDRVRPHHF